MEAAKQIVLNRWSDASTDTFSKRNLLTAPQIWAVLDYGSIEDPNIKRSNMIHEATRDGTAHGLLVWFDAELAEGIGYSNGPQVEKIADVYGRGFFPLLEPVAVKKGDRISLAIQAELVGGVYEWHWHTRIQNQSDPRAVKADFKQSTAFENALTVKRLAKSVSNDRPNLGEDGRIDLYILVEMGGESTIGEIARQTRAQFPARFGNEQEALIYVYELSQQYKQ